MKKENLELVIHSVATGELSIDKACDAIFDIYDKSKIGQQTTIFDKVTHHSHNIGKFSGSDYIKSIDESRLKKQYEVIKILMSDGKWRTLQEIEVKTGYPQSSISAQLRNLRKKSFGSNIIDKRRRGDRSIGLFEYKLKI